MNSLVSGGGGVSRISRPRAGATERGAVTGVRRGSASSQRLLGEFEWIAAVTMLAWGSVAHFADRIAVWYLGRIVEAGPAKDVVRTHSIPTRSAALSCSAT